MTGTYSNMATKASDKLTATVSVAFSVSKERVEKSENAEATIAAINQIALEKNKLATQLRDEGKVAEAAKLFGDNAAILKSYGDRLNCVELQENAAGNYRAQTNAASTSDLWELERKNLRNNQRVIESPGKQGLQEINEKSTRKMQCPGSSPGHFFNYPIWTLRLKLRLIAVLVLLVVAPVALLGWLGRLAAEGERETVRRNFRKCSPHGWMTPRKPLPRSFKNANACWQKRWTRRQSQRFRTPVKKSPRSSPRPCAR